MPHRPHGVNAKFRRTVIVQLPEVCVSQERRRSIAAKFAVGAHPRVRHIGGVRRGARADTRVRPYLLSAPSEFSAAKTNILLSPATEWLC